MDPEDGGADDDTNWPKTVSSAAYVEDVNEDPVLIVNGLTKNWRCPGFRICWIVGPKPICEMLSSAGSFLDGGANAPLQKLALPLMDMDFIRYVGNCSSMMLMKTLVSHIYETWYSITKGRIPGRCSVTSGRRGTSS